MEYFLGEKYKLSVETKNRCLWGGG